MIIIYRHAHRKHCGSHCKPVFITGTNKYLYYTHKLYRQWCGKVCSTLQSKSPRYRAVGSRELNHKLFLISHPPPPYNNILTSYLLMMIWLILSWLANQLTCKIVWFCTSPSSWTKLLLQVYVRCGRKQQAMKYKWLQYLTISGKSNHAEHLELHLSAKTYMPMLVVFPQCDVIKHKS